MPVAQAVIKYLPSVIIPHIFRFLFLIVVTHFVTPDTLGIYGIITSTVYLFDATMFLWGRTALIRFHGSWSRNGRLDRAFASYLRLMLIIIIILIITPVVLAYILKVPYYDLLLLAGIYIILRALFTLLQCYYRCLERAKVYNINESMLGVLMVVLPLLLVHYYQQSPQLMIIGLIMAHIIVTVPHLKLVVKLWNTTTATYYLKKLFIFNKYEIPSALIEKGLYVFDRYFIAIVISISASGIFNAGVSFVNGTIAATMQALLLGVYPVLMRETAVAGNNIAKLSQSYSHNMTIILAIILPSCVGLAIMGEDIGILLLDDQFLISGSIIIPLACVTMAIDAFILNSVNHAFHITQKMKYPLYILLVMALIELAIKLIWWDISMMQILYINICVSTLALIASIILAKRVMKFSIPWQNIMIIAMATTAMGYSVNLYGVASGYIDLVIKMIIGIGVYGSITYVLFRTYTKTLSLR